MAAIGEFQPRPQYLKPRRPAIDRGDREQGDVQSSNRRLGLPGRQHGVTTKEGACFPIATLSIADHDDFPDRASLIGYLVAMGWPKKKVATFFSLTPRTIRRQTTPDRLAALSVRPRPPEPLTRLDVARMRENVIGDSFMTPEDRESALAYLDSACPPAPG